MSRRIEWATAEDLAWEIHDQGDDLGYDEGVTAELGLFLGSGEDGLIIEGTSRELANLLRRLADRIEARAMRAATAKLVRPDEPDEVPALTWEESGSDEPRDRAADSRTRPGYFWAIGPLNEGLWSVTLFDPRGDYVWGTTTPTAVHAAHAAARQDATYAGA